MDPVRYSGIEIWRAEFPLRLSFAHNLASRDSVETLIVLAKTAGGAIGFGQALPRSYLTGESLESAAADIRERWWPMLAASGIAAGDVGGALADLEPIFAEADAGRRNASYAALELAAIDAFARERRISAAPPRLDETRAGLPLVGAISAGSPGKAAWTARILRWLGYRHFKIKVGTDRDADLRRLRAVRRAAGANAWLAADANAAWTAAEAAERMRELRECGVRLIEEPLRPEDAAGADFRGLEAETGLPVMADESLCTIGDARKLLGNGSPSWWNLRVAKNGGFSGVGRLAAMARDHGIAVYGGILVGETGVLTAASLDAALANGARCAEYGFPRIFLKGDPFRGAPGGYSGRVNIASRKRTGFGVFLRQEKIWERAELVWRDDGRSLFPNGGPR